MADDDKVKLQSGEGEEYELLVKAAKLSTTVKDLMEDAGVAEAIPIANVEGPILKKIVSWMTYHNENPTPKPEVKEGEEQKEPEKRTDDICEWDQEFCKVELDELYALVLAANFLDIKELLETLCKTIANMIKGKEPDAICAAFNMKNDFTPEEIKVVMDENDWLAEREKANAAKEAAAE